jgi:DNA-binding XRE family transcriptional regulator
MIRSKDPVKARGDKFRALLKACRIENGLTQQELADRAGISVDSIRAMEGGRSANPSFFLAMDILKVLKVDMGDAAKWAEET